MATSSDVRLFMWRSLFGSTYIPKNASLSGKTIVVTGSNTGLGFEAAKHIARLGASRIILACRSEEKGKRARDEIIKQCGREGTKVEVWKLDLSSFASVLAFAERTRSTLPRLDAFIANAGVEKTEYTETEGIETTITVNVISTMLLNIAVLPVLRDTSSKYNTTTTLTIVGSSVHIFGEVKPLLLAPATKDTFDLLSDPASADMGGPDSMMSPRYAVSKTLLHALVPHLAKVATSISQPNADVVVNILNPGWCESELSRDKNAPSLGSRISSVLMKRTTEQGSRTLVHAILAGKATHGQYLSECRVTPQSDFLRSSEGKEFGDRVWQELIARIRAISPDIAAIVA